MLSDNTCLNIIAHFLIGVGIGVSLLFVCNLIGKLWAIADAKQMEEAEYQCYLSQMKQEEERKKRQQEAENWDNIRPRWEEHIKYFNRLPEEQRSHLQVSFKEDKSDEK